MSAKWITFILSKTVSMVYRSCAIPVAIIKGNEKVEWNTHWLAMLNDIKANIPGDYIVFVMTDSGLYSPKIYKLITKLKWHPLMRTNGCGFFKEGDRYFQPIKSFAKAAGTVPDITQECSHIVIRKRRISVCRLGWIKILAKLIRHGELPFGMFIPEPMVEVSQSLAIQRSLRKTKKKPTLENLTKGG